MFNNDGFILPCNLPNWKYVVKYITEINDNYDKLKTIAGVINTLRGIKNVIEDNYSTECWQDSFLGLGMFLERYTQQELKLFISNNFRNILFYVQMNEKFTSQNMMSFSYSNNVVRLSIAAGKSLLACGVFCLMPLKFLRPNNGNSQDPIVNICFDDLFKGINFGSENHINLFNDVVQYFSSNSKDLLDKEMDTFITISLQKNNCNCPLIDESLVSWPIILSSNLSVNNTAPSLENLWPTCFEDINPPNYLNHLQSNSDRSLGNVCPLLVLILPILTFGFADFLVSNVINISWDKVHHTLYRILPVDHWNLEPQYSLEYITAHMMDCFQGFQCLLGKYLSNRSQFANSLTKSVIEDAINKLHMNKSRETFAHNRSISNVLDSRKEERPSLANIFYNAKRPREASMSGSSSSSRSSRQSYSTTSSSRSGSLQFSSMSSRRSSNISNKDPEYNTNAISEKNDFTSHVFHPIILEESNMQVDDDTEDECLLLPHRVFQEFSIKTDFPSTEIQLDELMTAPISDSTKLSLSKEFLHVVGDKSPQTYFSKRRNSSPTLGSLTSKDSYKTLYETKKMKVKMTKRCCEEDASNSRLENSVWSRSKNHGRRQSLPCHLQWVYQLPLTDSVKLNLSQSHILKGDTGDGADDYMHNLLISDWSDNFLQNKVFEESTNIIRRLVDLANQIVQSILPEDSRKEDQMELRNEILRFRSITESETSSQESKDYKASLDDQLIFVTQNDSLHSNDLATFDRELYSSSFFDDEALQFFRQFSHLHLVNKDVSIHSDNGDNDISKCDVCGSGNRDESGAVKWTQLTGCQGNHLIDYVNQLTTVIITEAIAQEKNCPNLSSHAKFSRFADNISVDIIATSLVELASTGKEESKLIHPIYLGSLPADHDHQIGTLMQIISSCLSQSKIGRMLVLVCDDKGDSILSEIIGIIHKNRDRLTPYRMYNIMIQYYTNKHLRRKFHFKEFLIKMLSE